MTTGPDQPAGPRWGLLALLMSGCLPLVVAAGLVGFIYGADFASGGRAPVRSAVFWAASGAASAIPVASLPWLGFRVRRPAAVDGAGAGALVVAVTGWLLSR